MAGDWIKMSTGLRTHPKIVRIVRASRSDKLRVVGALHAVWCIFDEHSEDGYLDGYTLDAIDHETFKGFAKALVGVGWLEEEADGLRVPRFDTHNGASAKRRAQETERKRADRGQKPDAKRTESGQVSASDADEMRTREEKRREEQKQDLPSIDDDTGSAAGATDPPVASSSSKGDPLQTRAIEIVVLCRAHGATLTASDPNVRDWAGDGTSDAQLLTAIEQAQEQRHRRADASPINSGYLASILAGVRSKTPVYDHVALAKLLEPS